MADARSKKVLGSLADLWTRADYVIDKITNLSSPLGYGDIIEVPDISALTIGASGAADVAAQSITTNILSLACNLQPLINAELPLLSRIQLLDGNWAGQVAMQAATQLKNDIDNALCRDYLAESLCWTTGTDATYHANVAGDALTEDDILNAQALLLSTDGTLAQNLALFVSPYAQGSIMSIAGFVPNFGLAEQGMLGVPKIGSVFGIPVYVTNSIRRNKTIATTAVTVATNVATITVAAGHGVVAGQRLTNSGWTNSATNTSAVTVTSTTSTTIVMPYTAADGAQADGTGTVSDATSWNLMMDISGVYSAQQALPSVRMVPNPLRTSDNLQVAAIWGRVGRAGKCVTVHSPGSSVS